MACTKCDIKGYAINSAKAIGLEPTKANLIARMVYEQLQSNEAFAKAPAGEGGRFAACVKKMTGKPRKKGGKPRTEEEAKALCGSIGRKKFGAKKMGKMAAKGRREASAKNESVFRKKFNEGIEYSADEAIIAYEMAFKDVLALKLSPIKKYEDIENIREQMWKAEDRLHDTKWAFMRIASGNEDERKAKLLNTRLRIRENFNSKISESNTQNQKKVHETETSTRERQFDPEDCQDNTFRTIDLGKDKKGVICKKKGEDKTSLQSIITPKKTESVQQNENDDFLGEMQGKNKAERLQILKRANPDIDLDILKDIILQGV